MSDDDKKEKPSKAVLHRKVIGVLLLQNAVGHENAVPVRTVSQSLGWDITYARTQQALIDMDADFGSPVVLGVYFSKAHLKPGAVASLTGISPDE